MARYIIVSDLPEWTVHDCVTGRDIMPTKSGNRDYCSDICTKELAQIIADALNKDKDE